MSISNCRRRQFRKPKVVFSLVSIIVLFFAGAVAFAQYCTRIGDGSENYSRHEAIEMRPGGILLFQAAITAASADRFIRLVDQNRSAISKVMLFSFGGMSSESSRMAAAIWSLPSVTVEVPAGGICESACIQLLASHAGPMSIASTATLMFHSVAGRFGLASTGPCGSLNSFYVTIQTFFHSLIRSIFHSDFGEGRAMEAWAWELSPVLPALFSLCNTNPLDTQTGIFLSGEEFYDLRSGRKQPRDLAYLCPKNLM